MRCSREFVGMLTAAAVMVLMVIALCLYQIIAEAVTGASGPHWQQARWCRVSGAALDSFHAPLGLAGIDGSDKQCCS